MAVALSATALEGVAMGERGESGMEVTDRSRGEAVAAETPIGRPGNRTAGPPEPALSPMRGRARESATLDDLLSGALGGRGGSLVVTGEVGIGKSRLLAELAERASRSGFACWVGRGDPVPPAQPFGALFAALGVDRSRVSTAEPFAGERPNSSLAGPPPLGERWSRLLARLDATMAVGARSAHAGVAADELVDAVLAHVERHCAQRPAVLIVDDLQWADEFTLNTLAVLARTCRDVPLVVAVAARLEAEPVAWTPLARALARIEEAADWRPLRGGLDRTGPARVERVTLGGLARSEVALLANDVLGAVVGESVLAETERAAGNPFFVVELLAGMARERLLGRRNGVVEVVSGTAPVGLRAEVLRRLDVLDRETAEVIRLAAVLGRAVDPEVLSVMTGKGAAALAGDLLSAFQCGLLEEEGDSLVFRHELLRQVLYESFPRSLRRHLHLDAARALRDRDEQNIAVARQYAAAVEAGAPVTEEVIHGLSTAALGATVLPPQTEARYLELIVRTLPRADPRRWSFSVRLANAQLLTGRLAEAEALAGEMITDPAASSQAATSPESCFELGHTLGRIRLLRGDLGGSAETFGRLSTVAGHAGWQPPSSARSQLLADAALTAALAGRVGDGERLAEEACELAAAADASGPPPVAVAALAQIAGLRADVARAVDLGAEAVTLSDCRGPETHHVLCCLRLAQLLLWADDVEACTETLARARRLGQQLGASWVEPMRQEISAELLCRMGNWDGAEAEITAALTAGSGSGSRFADAVLHCLRARIATHRRSFGEARAALEAAEEHTATGARGEGDLAWVRALLSEAMGHLDGALEQHRELWGQQGGSGHTLGQLRTAPDLVRLACRIATPAALRVAEDVAATTASLAQQHPDAGSVASLTCSGLLAGDGDELRHAASLADSRNRPVDAAVIRAQAATLFEGRGDRGAARSTMARARPLLEQLGMRPLPVAPRRTESRGSGRRLARALTPHRPSFGWESLTATELRVVELVGRGQTNDAIAEELMRSRRTVESHLHHVYTKLGMSSRVALAIEAQARASRSEP